jgi:hypothetical protein
MLSKIFKNENKKKKTLSEPIISVCQKLSENTKPIVYYSVDKQEYVTVYVPDHMSLYTKTPIQNKTLIQDKTPIQDKTSHKKIKTLSYNEQSLNMIKGKNYDRLNEIYEYYTCSEFYVDIDTDYNINIKNNNSCEKNNNCSIYSNI